MLIGSPIRPCTIRPTHEHLGDLVTVAVQVSELWPAANKGYLYSMGCHVWMNQQCGGAGGFNIEIGRAVEAHQIDGYRMGGQRWGVMPQSTILKLFCCFVERGSSIKIENHECGCYAANDECGVGRLVALPRAVRFFSRNRRFARGQEPLNRPFLLAGTKRRLHLLPQLTPATFLPSEFAQGPRARPLARNQSSLLLFVLSVGSGVGLVGIALAHVGSSKLVAPLRLLESVGEETLITTPLPFKQRWLHQE
ncbi:hypothetical protein KSP40_PGU003612 [Platanthera guangdongensis]|uniref:Uncharacterized protein n=1 Tax=Platanthera guangdongensis TaxID=2320717 RepID=A0ABR2MU03_9ASPA